MSEPNWTPRLDLSAKPYSEKILSDQHKLAAFALLEAAKAVDSWLRENERLTIPRNSGFHLRIKDAIAAYETPETK